MDIGTRAYGGVADRLERAVGLPRPAYADPEVFAVEAERVLRAGWVAVARESDLAPGTWRAADVAGTPLLVSRDAGGEVRVLSGVCRHRGFRITGSGEGRAIACPYHLWRYGLDGALLSAPAMDRSEVFDREQCGLPGYRTELWGGWVFVNVSGTAAPLAPQLAPLAQRLAAYAPEQLVTAGTLEFDSPWNWKVLMENFLESYHHIGPHGGSLQQTNPGLGTYEGQGSDAYTVLENPAVDGGSPFVVAAIFPLALTFFTEGAMNLGAWYEIREITTDRFALRIHMLAPPALAASPEFVEGFKAQLTHIHLEDIPACDAVQAGVTSPGYVPGPLSHLEASVWRFHRHLAARMAAQKGALSSQG